jgi:hypothetical protein
MRRRNGLYTSGMVPANDKNNGDKNWLIIIEYYHKQITWIMD